RGARQHPAHAGRRDHHGSHRQSHSAHRLADTLDGARHGNDRAHCGGRRCLSAAQNGDRMSGVSFRTVGHQVVQYRLLVMLAAIAILGGLTLDDFLTANTLRSILDRATVVGFLALALTPLLIAGQIDLSIGSIMSMSAFTTIAM